ncbi:MAG: hypothetical protein ACXWVS_08370 [Hyphomicrobium sp.]
MTMRNALLRLGTGQDVDRFLRRPKTAEGDTWRGGSILVKLVIAIYEDVAVAQKAVDAVITAGLPQRDVSILSNETIAAIPGAVDSGEPGPLGDAEVSGADLVSRLTALRLERRAAEGYAESVRRGGALVAVRADGARAAEAAEIMDSIGALDFEAQIRSWQIEGWSGYDPEARPFSPAEADAERRRRAERSPSTEQKPAPDTLLGAR